MSVISGHEEGHTRGVGLESSEGGWKLGTGEHLQKPKMNIMAAQETLTQIFPSS